MLARFIALFALAYMPLLLSCSKDQPAPTSPASKITATVDAPAAPTNLRVEALTDTSAKVAWDAVEGATDYDLNYRTLDGRWTNWPIQGARRAYTTIYELAPDTEYRWAVRAENSDGSSDWIFGKRFTTLAFGGQIANPYIRIRTDGSLSEVGLKSVKEAVAEWNAVIIAGPLDSLVIEFNAIPSHEYVAFVDPKGSAEGLEFKRVEGDRVIARCLAKALSIDAFNEAYHPEINLIRQKNIWAHEIGHCLGIGLGSRWDRQVEYQPGYTLHIDTDEKIPSDKTYPHFVGPSAQAEFLRLSEGGWDTDKWPHVPLDWSKYYGSDHRHLATPLFWRNYMAYSTWGNEYRKAVASLDAAFLEDLGYTVRWDQVQDTEMTGGYRHIYIRRDSSKRLVIEREKIYDAVETLLFPAHPLVFIETDWSPMAYYPAVIME